VRYELEINPPNELYSASVIGHAVIDSPENRRPKYGRWIIERRMIGQVCQIGPQIKGHFLSEPADYVVKEPQKH